MQRKYHSKPVSDLEIESTGERRLTRRPRYRMVSAILMGTLLNPLNSSMIAVALVLIQERFQVNAATVSLLLSSFALAAAIAQPLMGRFSDLFGPRRIFCLGLLVVGVTSAFAPFVPAFGWVVAVRMGQALGTSAAYPAGLAIIRAGDPHGKAPAATLGAISITSSVSVALGPVLGGFLAMLFGWAAIFLVNIPLTAVGLFLALRWLPADAPSSLALRGERRSRRSVAQAALRMADVPGIILFGSLLASLLAFLLSLASRPLWLLLPVALLAAILLVLRERSVSEPFLNVRMLAANRPLIGVYAQFAGVNIVFYAVFYGLPLWLEQARGFGSGLSGLLLLPISGIGVLATPVAARLITKAGYHLSLLIGYVTLTAGSLLLLVFTSATPIIVILAVGVVLGIPNGFNNLGLQAALYEQTAPEYMGAAGGQFQTFRYVGAILATSLLGTTITSHELHLIAVILTIISAILLASSLLTHRQRGAQGK